MTSQTLGRLEQVDLRTIWATEATAFTPWLAQPENLAILGETLGIDLELRAAEDRIAQLHEEVEHLQDRANRAEQWLETIKREIEDNLIASIEANRREPLAVLSLEFG